MASRAKLTLVPNREEHAAPPKEAVIEPGATNTETRKPSTPSSGALVKGLLLVGLTAASLVVFKRKIF